MKIYDMHVHASKSVPNTVNLLENMRQAGVYGGSVFSTRPIEANKEQGWDFKKRLNEILTWADGYENRIFPVLWIHPYEKNIIKKIDIAANEGVKAFKIICTDFYPNENRCMKVYERIARHNLPVCFHSGILWNGAESSKYNRPLYFERLIEIDNFKFSLGHCSWPWIDECIALYGKFLNGITSGNTAEMFFDITPGTPVIYREELLTKLFTIGYDVPNNIMFGTDNRVNNYNFEWAKKWIEIDEKIFDKLGVNQELRENIYEHNYLRFMGVEKDEVKHISPVPDNDRTWSLQYYKK